MKRTVRSRILSIATAAILSCGMAASSVEAAINVDNFESYASEAALDAAWFPVTAAHAAIVPATLDTVVSHSGAQSLRIDYNCGTGQFFGQLRHDFASQNWSTLKEVEFWYMGQATNSQETLGLRFYSSFGTEIGRVEFPIAQTKVTGWTRGVLDLTNFTHGPAFGQQNDVTQVRIAVTPSEFGTGVLWFDDIRVVPEPASMGLGLLGVCSCLLYGRKRSPRIAT